jgi:folate-binding protein YgfZ
MADRLPLHELHLTAGAVVTARDGWEVPDSYGDPAAEYAAVREGTGLLDRGDLSAFAVTGRDRAAFLHAMLSNDVKSIRPGQGCRAALLDIQGKVQVILLLLATEDQILVLAPPGCAAATVETLDKYLFSEKVSFRDVTGEVAPLVLAGPGAPAAAQQLAGTLPGEARWSHGPAAIEGAEVRLVRGGVETGGAEIWMLASPDVAPRLWRTARDAGARPVGRAAQEALRIEAGAPRFGADVDASVLLPEIPSADLVSATKGCYIGQEVVVRIRDRGHVNRHLRGLLVDGTAVPAPGARVLVEGVEVGKVTSSAWSYSRERPIALAFVRRQHAEPGTPVTVCAGEDRCAARVSDLPFPR